MDDLTQMPFRRAVNHENAQNDDRQLDSGGNMRA